MPLSFSSFDPSSKKIIPLEDPSSKLKPKELKSLDKTVKVVAGESLLTEKSTADNSDAATDLKISAAASHDKSAKPSTLWNMIGRVFSVLESFFYESSSTPKTEASAESTPTNELSDDEPVVALAIDSPIKEEAISLQHSHDSSPLPHWLFVWSHSETGHSP